MVEVRGGFKLSPKCHFKDTSAVTFYYILGRYILTLKHLAPIIF